MTIIKELAVVKRKYTNDAGEEKSVWQNIGAIHTSKEGREYMVLDPMINLAAIPRKEGDDRVFVSMFEPKPKGEKAKGDSQKSQPQGGFNDIESDIPF